MAGRNGQARQPKRVAAPAVGGEPEIPLSPEAWERVAVVLKLSAQQARIVELLLQGKRDKQIAAALDLSVPTVRTYLSRMFARAGVEDRVELILRVFWIAHEFERSECHQT